MTNTGYENAPATQLIAVHCCACSLPLVDSDSVELGIGPVCRKKLGKLDADGVPEWEACAESLALFSVANPGDDEARVIFEQCLDNLDTARKGIEPQKLANLITHYVAAVQHRHDAHVGHLVDALMHMGRPNLSKRLRERLYTVRIEIDGTDMLVTCPYSDTFRDAMWNRGKRVGAWDRPVKAFRVPLTHKSGLMSALKRAYPNTNAHGPKGEFRIEA